MASALKFELNGKEYEAVPVKLERRKLYGYTETVARDAGGGVCKAAQIDPDGELLVPSGGTKAGLLDEDGVWVERSELVATGADGKALPIVASSFGQTIKLEAKAGAEEFLDHEWKSVYQLENAELAAAVGTDIYGFVFNYRSDASPDDGYLAASEGKVFLFDGEKIAFEYIGIEEEGVLDDLAEEAPAEEDELDFGMM